jgi:hypothetical protein
MAFMEETRLCAACGLKLVGPFGPRITLTMVQPSDSGEEATRKLQVVAHGWFCPGCGLLHWYAGNEYLKQLLEAAAAAQSLTGRSDTKYERRAHMLRMLQQVRRL